MQSSASRTSARSLPSFILARPQHHGPRRHSDLQQRICTVRSASSPASSMVKVVELSPGYRGLVAACNIPKGQQVLNLPNSRSLKVPIETSTEQWEREWLVPFEEEHGSLPPELVHYLADSDNMSNLRLAALLLYMQRQHADGGSSNSDKTGFWASWLQQLPPQDQVSLPNNFWDEGELQLEPMRTTMAVISQSMPQMYRVALSEYTTFENVRLAETVSDVAWAMFILKTRSSRGDSYHSLHPMHDCINHSDDWNCSYSPSDDRMSFVVTSECDIPEGAEITISYDSESSRVWTTNLDFLRSWGFTTPARPADSALLLPQSYKTLPSLDWQLAVAAAAAVTMLYVQQQQHSHGQDEGGRQQQSGHADAADALEAKRLVIAAGALPLLLPHPAPSALSSSAAAGVGSSATGYEQAAAVLAKVGLFSATQYQYKPQPQEDAFGEEVYEAFKHPNLMLQADLREAFAADVAALYREVEAAASSHPDEPDLVSYMLARWQQQCQVVLKGMELKEVKVQAMVAQALLFESQLLLLQCSTTLQQDEQLLAELKQQLHNAAAAAPAAAAAALGVGAEPAAATPPAAAGGRAASGAGAAQTIRARPRGALFSRPVSSSSSSKPTASQVPAADVQPPQAAAAAGPAAKKGNLRPRGALFSRPGSSSSSSSKPQGDPSHAVPAQQAAAGTAASKEPASGSASNGRVKEQDSSRLQEFTQLLQECVQLQQSAVTQLVLLRACDTLDAASSSSNSDKTAATQVLAALHQQYLEVHSSAKEMLGHPPGSHNARVMEYLLQQIQHVQTKQAQLMQQLQQLQGAAKTESSLAAAAAAAAASASSNRTQLMVTAVTARLEQKRLLVVFGDLCRQMESELVPAVRAG